jgi:hypothetical protein
MTYLDHRPSFLLHPSRLFLLPLFLLYPAVQKRPLGGVRQKVHSEGDGEELFRCKVKQADLDRSAR